MAATSETIVPPPTLCGRAMGKARHACAFVGSDEEAYGIFGPFVQEGIERGEDILQIVPDGGQDDHVARLAAEGVDMSAAMAKGQANVLGWSDAYLKGGAFDPDAMIALVESHLQTRRKEGYALTRGLARMEWALTGAQGTERLLEYESRLNFLTQHHPDPLVCTYDTSRFDAGTVLDILRVHPAAIVGGLLVENPYYVQPERMLRELRARQESA